MTTDRILVCIASHINREWRHQSLLYAIQSHCAPWQETLPDAIMVAVSVDPFLAKIAESLERDVTAVVGNTQFRLKITTGANKTQFQHIQSIMDDIPESISDAHTWMVMCDDDDWAGPTRVSDLCRAIKNGPNYSVLASSSQAVPAWNEPLPVIDAVAIAHPKDDNMTHIEFPQTCIRLDCLRSYPRSYLRMIACGEVHVIPGNTGYYKRVLHEKSWIGRGLFSNPDLVQPSANT